MKSMTFHAAGNRSGNLLHIETDGGIVNIRVGLTDAHGRAVTSVEIIRDNYAEEGGVWDLDGHTNNRLIQLDNCTTCRQPVMPSDEDDGIYHLGQPPADGHAVTLN